MPASATKKVLLSAAAIALLAGGFATVHLFNNGEAGAQMPGGEMPAMPVPVIEVTEKPIQIWKEFSGKLIAVDYAEIRPQVDGLVEQVHFQDGQIVKKGDLLYTIDIRPYAAAVAEARAQVAAANEDHVYAAKELERAGELAKTGALSKAVYDQRVNAEKVAKSAINSANARLKSAQVNLDRATIEAPIDGRVGRAEITVGNLVSAAAAPLLTTIVSDKDIYADFEVDEQTYLKYVRLTANDNSVESEQAIPVRMKMTDDDKMYDGRIKSFDNKIDSSSGTIRVRAIFANEDGALLPGMFAQVMLGSSSEEARMTVPEKAIGTDQDRKYVYIIEDGAAAYREVKLGDANEGERIVLSGLKTGDKVIIDNLMKIRPGAKVQGMSPEELEKMKAGAAAQAASGGAPAAEAPKEESAAPAAAEPAKEEEAAPAETSAVPEIEEPSMLKADPNAGPEGSEEVPLVIPETAPATPEETPATPAQE